MKIVKENKTVYTGKNLDFISFPMGGIGAGMMCLDGTGSFSHISLKHKPDLKKYAYIFATLAVNGKLPRVLEGAVPDWKIFTLPGSGNGLGDTHFGLPRCNVKSFAAQFPFCFIKLNHPDLPIKISISGWSPFIPCDPDNSSLPVAAVEYTFENYSSRKITGTFSFHCKSFIAREIKQVKGARFKNGFILFQAKNEIQPHEKGYFLVQIPDEKVAVNFWCGNGSFGSTHAILWKEILSGQCLENKPDQEFVPGASAYARIVLNPGESKTIKVLFSWYVVASDIKVGDDSACCYQPWYAERFKSIEDVSDYWLNNYKELKKTTKKFTNAFYLSNIPSEIKDAIASNLPILKSPTVLRQKDGRLWCWEGCHDTGGCCAGSCTHVWNYSQAIAHLFPSLERTLRETEFYENQSEDGHQDLRALLPIRKNTHSSLAAADG
ncbi:MAG: GH116 family glycosyl-hydrolase [Candidatus Omnitrophica bacterium]|nr:GH116 family glycosyl-hydrolase [Candidatus Omnitrophota bacterium]